MDGRAEISGFTLQGSGIGFTNAHRDVFDALYTNHRIERGGKCAGRLIYLKYYKILQVDDVYFDGIKIVSRSFVVGTSHDIIVDGNEEP